MGGEGRSNSGLESDIRAGQNASSVNSTVSSKWKTKANFIFARFHDMHRLYRGATCQYELCNIIYNFSG